MCDRLIELIREAKKHTKNANSDLERNMIFADYLLANGVIVTPCVAMVEQFIENGKFDKKHTSHNGKYAVVYIDKSKWAIPLIDITEQSYNDEKAKERIQALKGGDKE